MYKNLNNWLIEELLPPEPDPRLSEYALMSSWTPSVLLSIVYSLGAYIWRLELIRRQKKTNSKKMNSMRNNTFNHQIITYTMILYNIIMVLFSTYLSISTLYLIYQLDYGLGCIELPDPTDKRTDGLVYYGYLYFISKFIEMMDTVFFLCRGKVDQVTFLHVFHHASMPPSVWWGLKYAPGGLLYMFPLVNSFVHILMYTYYGLAAAGLYHLLWWKNYLTLIQMIQFLWFILHQGQFLLPSNLCHFPKVFPAAVVIYASLFFILFLNFYTKAYWKKERLAKSLNIEQTSTTTTTTTTTTTDIKNMNKSYKVYERDYDNLIGNLSLMKKIN